MESVPAVSVQGLVGTIPAPRPWHRRRGFLPKYAWFHAVLQKNTQAYVDSTGGESHPARRPAAIATATQFVVIADLRKGSRTLRAFSRRAAVRLGTLRACSVRLTIDRRLREHTAVPPSFAVVRPQERVQAEATAKATGRRPGVTQEEDSPSQWTQGGGKFKCLRETHNRWMRKWAAGHLHAASL